MTVPFTKIFNPGEILTASDVNEHLLNGGYQFRETVYFTSSGTFVKADYPWLRAIRVKVQGGGGGGGGSASTGASQVAFASAGGGGGYAEKFITDIAGLAASVTVTRGAGGAGGAVGNNNGSAGGSSTAFGLTANGGSGGNGAAAGAYADTTFLAVGGGGASGGDINIDGGSSGVVFSPGPTRCHAPQGGSSFLSTNSGPPLFVGFGGSRSLSGPGSLYGGGGGSSCAVASTSAGGGSAGANGIVIVELYA
jgi:hypothetical protein